MPRTIGVEMTEISSKAKAARRRMVRGVAGLRSMAEASAGTKSASGEGTKRREKSGSG